MTTTELPEDNDTIKYQPATLVEIIKELRAELAETAELREALVEMVWTADQLMPGLKHISVSDYGRLNMAFVKARNVLGDQ